MKLFDLLLGLHFDAELLCAHGVAFGKVLGAPDPRVPLEEVQLHAGQEEVVGADLECLLATHEKANLASVLVLQELCLAQASLLPFLGFISKPEKVLLLEYQDSFFDI